MIEIPWQALNAATLARLIEEIVSRDGTDYGAVESSLASRRQQVMQALEQGRARLVWDEETASASLLKR